MREFKDTPLHVPFWLGKPELWSKCSWFVLAGWYLAAAAAISFEPDPSGMDIGFRWTYLLQGQLIALAIRLAFPLALLGLRPSVNAKGLIKISLGACVVWLWTSPLAWIWSSPMSGILLALAREAAWFGLLLAGAGLARPRNRIGRIPVFAFSTLLAVALSLVIQTLPDLAKAGGIRMDNVRSGRIVSGTPELPDGLVNKALWTLHGPADLLSAERLSLGTRQTVVSSGEDSLVVLVAPGSVPPPEDTSGNSTPSPSEGKGLDRLLEGIPAEAGDSLKLLMLHRRVHESIRYSRTYFPGNCDAILERGDGDCKAFAQLMTEGARRLGFSARRVHGLLASSDGYYAHAWTSIALDGRWTDWDPTSSAPFPDARYLRFSTPKFATGAFDGELGIFTLTSVEFRALEVLR